MSTSLNNPFASGTRSFRSTESPTTTYPFTFTTYSTSLPSTSFSTPTLIPSLFSFGPAKSCSANSVATPLPSGFPIDTPLGLKAACVISNAEEVNDHAFWDLYACCNGSDMFASGSPNPCTAQCVVENEGGQTWQELGECLSKRVDVVVCSPRFIEIARNRSGLFSSQSSSVSGSATVGPSGSGDGAQVSESTAAGSTVGVVHVGETKMGVVLFAMLAVGAFAGMMV